MSNNWSAVGRVMLNGRHQRLLWNVVCFGKYHLSDRCADTQPIRPDRFAVDRMIWSENTVAS